MNSGSIITSLRASVLKRAFDIFQTLHSAAEKPKRVNFASGYYFVTYAVLKTVPLVTHGEFIK